MTRALLVWLVSSAIGAAIIAVPDSGPRLISFSRAHGPSAPDLVGILVMLLGWGVFLARLWQQRGSLLAYTPIRGLLGGTFVLGLGTGLVIASAAGDYPHWWAVGAGLLLGAQLVAAYAASRSDAA